MRRLDPGLGCYLLFPSFPCAVSIDFNFNSQLLSPKREDETLGNTFCFVPVFI